MIIKVTIRANPLRSYFVHLWNKLMVMLYGTVKLRHLVGFNSFCRYFWYIVFNLVIRYGNRIWKDFLHINCYTEFNNIMWNRYRYLQFSEISVIGYMLFAKVERHILRLTVFSWICGEITYTRVMNVKMIWSNEKKMKKIFSRLTWYKHQRSISHPNLREMKFLCV